MEIPCKGEASVQWLARSFSKDTQTDRDPVTLLKGYETCRVLLQWYWLITTKQLKLDGYIIMPRFWNYSVVTLYTHIFINEIIKKEY